MHATKQLSLTILSCIALHATAQKITWQKSMGGKQAEYLADLNLLLLDFPQRIAEYLMY